MSCCQFLVWPAVWAFVRLLCIPPALELCFNKTNAARWVYRQKNRKQSRRDRTTMFRSAIKYARYAVTALATLGFGLATN